MAETKPSENITMLYCTTLVLVSCDYYSGAGLFSIHFVVDLYVCITRNCASGYAVVEYFSEAYKSHRFIQVRLTQF